MVLPVLALFCPSHPASLELNSLVHDRQLTNVINNNDSVLVQLGHSTHQIQIALGLLELLIHGSRQCGKTTLAQLIGEQLGYHYISFDDDNQLQAAKADPVGFIHSLPEKTILE